MSVLLTILATRSPILPSLTLPSTTQTLAITLDDIKILASVWNLMQNNKKMMDGELVKIRKE